MCMRGHRRVTKLCLLMGGQWNQLPKRLWIQLEASRQGEVSRRDGKEEFAPSVMKDVEAPSGKCDGSRGGGLHACIIVYVIRNICLSEPLVL